MQLLCGPSDENAGIVGYFVGPPVGVSVLVFGGDRSRREMVTNWGRGRREREGLKEGPPNGYRYLLL
jgi:hypothetical protein